jgi:hypothetical protein
LGKKIGKKCPFLDTLVLYYGTILSITVIYQRINKIAQR